MKEKLTWRHLLARGFSRTPESIQKVIKGIVKKETNKDKRVQLYNTVRWSSDNLNQVSYVYIKSVRVYIKATRRRHFRVDLLC